MKHYPVLLKKHIKNKKSVTIYEYNIDGNIFKFEKTKDGILGPVSVKLKYKSVIAKDTHSGTSPVKFKITTLFSKNLIPKLLGVSKFVYEYCLKIIKEIEDFCNNMEKGYNGN